MARTIELIEPFTFGRERITHIKLREPKFAELTSIPNPVSIMQFPNGARSPYIAPDVVREWIEALSDIDPNALQEVGARDTMQLQDAVLGFFGMAREPISSNPPAPQQENSSSASE
jgi:hypothetical protein